MSLDEIYSWRRFAGVDVCINANGILAVFYINKTFATIDSDLGYRKKR